MSQGIFLAEIGIYAAGQFSAEIGRYVFGMSLSDTTH